jgi:hypothetical protein
MIDNNGGGYVEVPLICRTADQVIEEVGHTGLNLAETRTHDSLQHS